ncbi:MAG: AAA family ATPase [Verrucomicrobiales bacterium]|nr:cytidylate kinase-like family protein [Verrucomicrobiota bacterium JB025]
MQQKSQLDLCHAYLRSAARRDGAKLRHRTGGPVITISREAGARGTSIAEEIIRKLDIHPTIERHFPWTLFNQDLLQHVIDEHDLPKGTASFFDEERHEHIRHLIGEILGLHPGTFTMMRKMAETTRKIAETGNSVIVGRGANFVTMDIARAVHVRFIGSPKCRTKHLAELTGLSLRDAAGERIRRDRGRKRYIKRVFKQDIDDPHFYDLIVNTDRLSNSQAADLIITALVQRMS